MIDTIVLLLPQPMFQITDANKFQPSATMLLLHGTHSLQAKQNSTKGELRGGIYKPRLTLMRSRNSCRELLLKIELSLPKLMFGNNFQELRYKDFAAVVQKLVITLAVMGVEVTVENMSQASVSAIHYAKNISLTDGSLPYSYITKIKEANIKLSLDTNKTDFRNEGHSYKWHCNSYEVVFYDKIHDLQKAIISSKRTLEKDNELQLHLCDRFKKRRKFELLRMEVRLNKRAKMKQLFAKLNLRTDLTFKKLFKPAISKKVLLHYLDELESRRPLLIDYKARSDEALLAELVLHNRDLSPKQIFQWYGIKKAMELMSLRDIRKMFIPRAQRSWHRLMADINKLTLPNNISSPFKHLREQLETFKPVRVVSQSTKISDFPV